MSRLMYISNLGKQIQYIEKAVATYPELIQGEVDICNMKNSPFGMRVLKAAYALQMLFS